MRRREFIRKSALAIGGGVLCGSALPVRGAEEKEKATMSSDARVMTVLREEGVHGSAWIWVHAQNERDPEVHARAAQQGAWLEFDGIRPKTLDRHVALAVEMKRRRFSEQVMASHDAGWYHVGEPGGGTFRPFDMLFTAFLPALEAEDFSEGEIRRLTVENPMRAFSICVRGIG